MKHLTLAEAEACVPQLAKIISVMFEIKAKAESKIKTIRSLEAKGRPDSAQIAIESLRDLSTSVRREKPEGELSRLTRYAQVGVPEPYHGRFDQQTVAYDETRLQSLKHRPRPQR